MPIEFNAYAPADLNPSWPTGTDSPVLGDDHLRLIKHVLRHTLRTLDKPLTKSVAQLEVPFAPGMVAEWFGDGANPPEGWSICDGTGGTPDLRDRFIIGAGGAFSVGNTGGTTTHTHTATTKSAGSHSHAITVNPHALTTSQIPAHTHEFEGTKRTQALQGRYNGTKSYYTREGKNIATETEGAGKSHKHTGQSANAGTHTHPITVNDKTGLRPPYFGLFYIIKT